MKAVSTKIAAFISCLYAMTGLGVMAFAEPSHDILSKFVIYGVIFLLSPLLCAYGLWFRKSWGRIFTLVFFLFQCVKPFTFLHWLPFYPPISLGIPFGDFTTGSAYLLDIFSIVMTAYLLIIWKEQSLRGD
ncbi:hypothetical protein FM038_009965 [Shewanella eurypsychrophilus]|uniref:Lycopene cyclase domain-containing protein n=1 Tax=Shewanella eurypsychrophilus TaxID=2593656 RepID=A0ABX6V521_9GAMM|nr:MULTISPECIES: hypothetical protein [Shewanella]QFU22450.1 hypothetical protein FS418_11545 [Shewanella sp. YLB-09]QPG57737.1 hypothetical protein FM038_009965 [Shewanella eurypsychrophilus]